ncbi:MAG: prepilin-type N-terminal cleavage/methylation domain-containing protein [Phycisphaeraceae bacterium]|nr:prepilin-type N-terminal cleavage/methylation domain-containing protein [Phycisphaeraceae bacterium]
MRDRWPVPSSRRVGFTLVELLVVIAIIGLLMGLLLPALGSARASGRSAVCLSQIKQIGSATLMYAQEHDDQLPRSSHSALAHRAMPWGYALCPYLGGFEYSAPGPAWDDLFNGLYRCPQDTRREQWSYGKSVWFELTAGETGEITGSPTGPVYPTIVTVPLPSGTILFGELASGSMGDHIMAHFWYFGGAPEVDTARHGSTSNYGFVDGHAESMPFAATFNLDQGVDLWNPGTAR